MIFARDYPGIYAVHENPASPEIHILLSNIAASLDGSHLTEEYQYSYDEVIMQCAAAFILSDLCGTSIPDDCVNPIKTLSDEERERERLLNTQGIERTIQTEHQVPVGFPFMT